MKIREYDPQTPPSPVNILPIHLYVPHNWLAKETRQQLLTCLPILPLRAYPCLNKLSLNFLNLLASSPNSFVTKEEP